MVDPILKILDQGSFERAELNSSFLFAVSIQNKNARPAELRPDFSGRRLNLYFDDTTEGEGVATAADIEALHAFGLHWLEMARINPALSAVVLHCGAGVSRSAAAALLLLSLYFGDYQRAASYLLRTHPHTLPNTHMLRLIFARLGPGYGKDIFAALEQGRLGRVPS